MHLRSCPNEVLNTRNWAEARMRQMKTPSRDRSTHDSTASCVTSSLHAGLDQYTTAEYEDSKLGLLALLRSGRSRPSLSRRQILTRESYTLFGNNASSRGRSCRRLFKRSLDDSTINRFKQQFGRFNDWHRFWDLSIPVIWFLTKQEIWLQDDFIVSFFQTFCRFPPGNILNYSWEEIG